MTEEVEDLLQRRVLAAYTHLAKQRDSWASQLIVLSAPGNLDLSLPYAGLILGALSLTISQDVEQLKQALRKGALDFLVNSRDEALRILRNEARGGRAISVGLEAEPASELAALVERGVAPAMVATTGGDEASPEGGATQWVEETVPATRNGLPVPFPTAARKEDTANGPRGDAPSLYRFVFDSFEQRRRFDGEAVGSLSGENRIGRRWLQSAERVLPRVRPVQRFLNLEPEEVSAINAVSGDFSPAEKL